MITWVDVTNVADERLEGAFALYERTFEEELREPREVLLAGVRMKEEMRPNGYHLVIGLDESDQVIAMASLHYMAAVRFGFLVYLLVDDRIRSKGLGSQLLFHVEQLLTADAAGDLRGIILETENEHLVHTDAEKLASQRRARFFDREGYRTCEGVHYLQPPLNPTTGEVQLELRAKLFGSDMLEEADLRRVVQAMYTEKYARVNGVAETVLARCYERLAVGGARG